MDIIIFMASHTLAGWGQIVHPLVVHTPGDPQKENFANLEGMFRIIQRSLYSNGSAIEGKPATKTTILMNKMQKYSHLFSIVNKI